MAMSMLDSAGMAVFSMIRMRVPLTVKILPPTAGLRLAGTWPSPSRGRMKA
jgi:hypothetical protein